MDRAGLAEFLRTRRDALQPENVGLSRGVRRKAKGLRREEVAALATMSTEYYARLEQQRGPQPSEQMIAAIARALRLTLEERDHLFLLAGRGAPQRVLRTEHLSPGMLRILDRLHDTPAQVMTGLAETLYQTPASVALVGDESHYRGWDRSFVYRWFAQPDSRYLYLPDEHAYHGRIFASQLRAAVTREGTSSRAAQLADRLLERSAEFRAIWADHQVGLHHEEAKRFNHPEIGHLELHCQILVDIDQSQSLLIYTATPGSESHDKLRLLTVIGAQAL